MSIENGTVTAQSFATFGELLRYLRRRARLTQRDLGVAVGYSEGHINRFEKNKLLPDPSAVAALFIPALDLAQEPALAQRLVELATASAPVTAHSEGMSESIPLAPPHEITRTRILGLARARLADEHRLVLCGLPGIGKTTLASALAREYEATRPVFWLTVAEGATASADVWAHRLANFLLAHGQDQVKPLVANSSRPAFEQQLALLGAALVQQPALICFDNAEIIRQEQACLQMLRYLSMTTPAHLLLTTRESLPLAKIPEITIDGFERDEALAFIAQNSEQPLDESQAARLVDKTGGNPMLLHLAMGQLRGHPSEVETFIAHMETQPQVASYLLQTFQTQSSPQGWRLLLLLAVFEQPLDLYDPYLQELVETLGGLGNIGAAIEELQRRHLIGDAATAHLHPFVREYVYHTLNAQTSLRQRLHRLAGDWLKDANLDAVAAARHYSHADRPEEALDWMEENRVTIRARGQALSAVAILDEMRLQIKGARSNSNDLLRRMLMLRGYMLMNTQRTREGENDLREAVALATSPAVRAAVICEMAELTSRRKDHSDILRLAQKTRAELGAEDLLLHARLVLIEAAAYRAGGDLAESDRKQIESLALADQMAGLPLTIADGIRAQAHYGLAMNANQRRESTAAMRYTQSALSSARAAHNVSTTNLCLNQLGILFKEAGNLEASTSYLKQAVAGMLSIGDVRSAAFALIDLAANHHTRGEDALALEQIERACEIFRAVNDMGGLAAAQDARTEYLIWEGRIQEAHGVIERVLQEAEGRGPMRRLGYRLGKLAMVQLLQGETDGAIANLRSALDLPSTRTRPVMHFVLHGTLALALAVAGDLTGAERALADTPSFEGLAQLVILERNLVEGFVALARGDRPRASDLAYQVLKRGGEYALYRQSAEQLLAAIEQNAPVNTFPHWLWVGACNW